MLHTEIHPQELGRIHRHVLQCLSSAQSAHLERQQRNLAAWQRFLAKRPPSKNNDSNYHATLIKEAVYAKLADEAQSLFGQGTEVVAAPHGASDYRHAKVVGDFHTYATFAHQPNAKREYLVWMFRKTLFGRAHMFVPWRLRKYQALIDGIVQDKIAFDGPEVEALWSEDFICPPEEVRNLHQFSWVARRYRMSVDDLIDGEQDGRYFGILSDIENVIKAAEDPDITPEDLGGYTDPLRVVSEEAEGVTRGFTEGADGLTMHEWYGKWRFPKKLKRDIPENDYANREPRSAEIVVRLSFRLNRIVGLDDLMDLYPLAEHRRPFVEAAMIDNGRYWCEGYGDLLAQLQDEQTANENKLTDAIDVATFPPVFARPAKGAGEQKPVELSPKKIYWTDDPNGMKQMQFSGDFNGPVLKDNLIVKHKERLTGITDQWAGRASEQPTAPRTFGGQRDLLERSDVRSFLEKFGLREDFAGLIRHLHMLWVQFGDERTWFRVTEETSRGMYDVRDGGAWITRQELIGGYDFSLTLASPEWSKDAEIAKTLERYKIDIANPIFMSDPRALWGTTAAAHKALGDPYFAELVPEPPRLDVPRRPDEEWRMIQQGETVNPHPLDQADVHIPEHIRQLEWERRAKHPSPMAIQAIEEHIRASIELKRAVDLQQAMLREVVTQAPQIGEAIAGIGEMAQGIQQPGAAPMMPPGMGNGPAN